MDGFNDSEKVLGRELDAADLRSTTPITHSMRTYNKPLMLDLLLY